MHGLSGPVPGAQTQTPGLVPPATGEDAGIRVPPGPLLQYYSDLSSGMLPPEDMRIEDLSFRVRIAPDGSIQFESPAVTVLSRYNFAFRRVAGWAMDPDLMGAAAALVSFQVVEQGRDFRIVKKPIPTQSLLSRSGSGNLAEWDGVYICVRGTDLAVEWTVDTQRWAGLVGATKELGVQLLGDYVVCRGNF